MRLITFLRYAASAVPRRLGRRRRLVDPLYDLAWLEEKGSLRLRPRRFDLARRVESVVAAVPAAEGEKFEIAIPPGLQVTLDPDTFDRIVASLVSNAVRYGEPPFRIATVPGEGETRVVFSDGGRGISPEFAPRLFDRFARSEISRKQSEGAGLGLALSRLYARANGGDLVYEATSDPGAHFCLILPAPSAELSHTSRSAQRARRRLAVELHTRPTG